MERIITLIACMASISIAVFAQQEEIDMEVNRLLSCGCGCFRYDAEKKENMNVFVQDLSYSVQKLHQHINDTTPCAKLRVYELTREILNYADSSNYDTVFYYTLLYARDTTNKRNYYNSIVYAIRNAVLHDIKLSNYVTQFIGSSEFYKATAWQLPLLVSYLDMHGEIENLKSWGSNYTLTEHAKTKLTIALVRLSDSVTTQEYVTMTPPNTNSDYWNWNTYITGLNYVRTKSATERLINLLDNMEKIGYSRYSYSDDPQTYYTTVRTLALETLALVVENFPLKEVDVPYEADHFSEASEKDFNTAKRWFKRNKNYKIIRRSNYNY
jgi:hypothetical protein